MIQKLAFALLASSSLYLANAQTQLKGWHAAPNLIYLQPATPVVKPAFTGISAGNNAYNSVYDSEGKLLLYVAGNNVYNKFDQAIASLSASSVGPTGLQNNIEIIPNPSNNTCSNKYYIVYAEGYCCGTSTLVRYIHIDMNLNSGLGAVIGSPVTLLTMASSGFPTYATSKIVSGKRYFYLAGAQIAGDMDVRKFDVTATAIGSPVLIAGPLNGSAQAAELELSDAGDKLAWVEGSQYGTATGTNDVNMIYLNPSTGLSTGAPNYIFSTNSPNYVWKGIEFDKTGNKLYVTKSGTGILVKDLTVAASVPPNLIASTANFSNSMLEKSYNGNEIICGSKATNQVRSIVTSTDLLSSWTITGYSLPSLLYGNNMVLMPSQIDGENYDASGTINVDVDIYNVSTSTTWNTITNPFYALQQNSYLGTLTSFPKVRVARQINIPLGYSITADQMNFEFQTNAEWNVNGGANLSLNGTILQAHPCGLMWRGVSVNNNAVTNASNFTMINSGAYLPIIYDAIRGAEINGTNVTTSINSSVFNLNEKDLVLNSVNPGSTSVTKSLFLATSPLRDQSKGQVLSTSGTTRYGITGIEANTTGSSTNKLLIGSATAGNGNYFESGQYGVRSYQTDIVIQNNEFVEADLTAVSADAAFAGARETDVISNTFTHNRTDTWVVFGCNQKTYKNTFTNTREFSMRWHYNYGNTFITGDATSGAFANTFQGYGWAGIVISDCDHTSTQIDIHRNVFKNAPWAGSVLISEATLTSAAKTYDHYAINNNSFSNVMAAVKILNVKGNAATSWDGDLTTTPKFDIQNNTISFSTAYDVSTKAIHVENSWMNRAFNNTVTSDNSADWQNSGIFFVNAPGSLIKRNVVQAGIGINLGLDVTESNILCNTLKYGAVGIGPGWSWLRSSGVPHGESGIRGRQNTFISNGTDISLYYCYTSNYQWISPNTTSIVYTPGGAYGTNIVYSTAEPSPCGSGNTRMGSDAETANPEIYTETSEDAIPENYRSEVMAAHNAGKLFAEKKDALASGAPVKADDNTSLLAMAQHRYDTKDYAGCRHALRQTQGQLSPVEKNMTTVLTILADQGLEKRHDYTAAEKASLENIAQSDSRVGGQGVHYARGILLSHYNLHYSDPYQPKDPALLKRQNTKDLSGKHATAAKAVYPNPASTELTIATSGSPRQITVYNSLGQKVYSQAHAETVTLDISSWQKGIYMLELTENNQTVSHKFVVQ